MNATAKKPLVAVSIGGGRGQSATLRAFRQLTDDITAIVTMFDSGGSSGILRREFGHLPFGDVRRCLVALAGDDEQSRHIGAALSYRFPSDSSVRGHTLGNLLFSSLIERGEDPTAAIALLSNMLNLTGRVLPVTFDDAELRAELADGSVLTGEANIDLRTTATPPIKKVALNKPVKSNPTALEAIARADLVVLGPGDLYTSIIPNLLPDGIAAALHQTTARVGYICNIMTKRAETDGYTTADFARQISTYTKGKKLDFIIASDSAKIPAASITEYEREHARPVPHDTAQTAQFARQIITADIAHALPNASLRHDSQKLAQAIQNALT